MKCPKCHYLSFDPEPRCRNCGYTLSLDPDLAIKLESAGADAPLVDLALREEAAPPDPPAPPRRTVTPPPSEPPRRTRTSAPGPFDEEVESAFVSEDDLRVPDRAIDDSLAPPISPVGEQPAPPVPAEAELARPSARQPLPPATAELPLFVKARTAPSDTTPSVPPTAPEPAVDRPVEVDEPPPFDVPGEPLPPLSVRRQKQPGRPRGHEATQPRLGPLDRDLLEGLQRIEDFEQATATAQARQARLEAAVGPVARLGAALVDAVLLGGLGVGLVWITLRWSGLTWEQASMLPVAPMMVFVLLLVVGYLFMFTAASGQTVGKMLARIRVVDAGDEGTAEDPVTGRQAILRGLITVPSVLAAGAGFLPGLVGEGRAVHDRLTRTRVVRA